MFGMGFTEILMIAVVAILFLGPDKLPDAMVSVAKFIRGAKKAIGDAKRAIDDEVKIGELKEEALGYKAKLDEATRELQGFKNINPIDKLNSGIEGIKEHIVEQPKGTSIEKKQDKSIVIKKRNGDEK